jgi:hypothetical protein
LARLPLVVDPITPDGPLIIAVFTAMKKDVFGPHIGGVVARGVTVDVSFDPQYVDRYIGWRVVPSAVQEAQVMARWRATPEGRAD